MRRNLFLALLGLCLTTQPQISYSMLHISSLEYDVVELTLHAQSTIHLDSTLYRHIDSTLTIARGSLDTLENIHVFPKYVHNELIVGDATGQFLATWGQGQTSTGIQYIDSLCTEYGLTAVDPHYELYPDNSGWVLLSFDEPANMVRLAELFDKWPGVAYSSPNSYMGDGTDVLLNHRQDGDYYGFTIGLGDFIYGCGGRYWWYVKVQNGLPSLEWETDYNYQGPIPFWDLLHWHFTPNGYTDAVSIIDTIGSSTRWWATEHAIKSSVVILRTGSISTDLKLNMLRDGLTNHFNQLLDAYESVKSADDPDLVNIAEDALVRSLGPYPFKLTGPAATYYAEDFNDQLEWTEGFPAAFADSFTYVIRLNNGDTGVFFTDSTWINLGDLQSELDLQRDVRYTWQVEARCEADSTRKSETQQVWSFEITDPVPTTTIFPVCPVPGDTVLASDVPSYQRIRFRWTRADTSAFTIPFHYRVSSVSGSSNYYPFNTSDTTVTMWSPSDFTPGIHTINWSIGVIEDGVEKYVLESTFYFDTETASLVDSRQQVPMMFAIDQVYPNPFNPTMTAVVALPERAQLKLEVFNLLGQRVALLSDGAQEAGYRRFVFDGTNLASGVYLLRATVPEKLERVLRITLVR